MALQAAGYTRPWRSAYVLVQLLLGIALIAAFVLWEYKGAKNPTVPAALFQGQRVVVLVYAVAFVAGMNVSHSTPRLSLLCKETDIYIIRQMLTFLTVLFLHQPLPTDSSGTLYARSNQAWAVLLRLFYGRGSWCPTRRCFACLR